jgi:hypothetical protein
MRVGRCALAFLLLAATPGHAQQPVESRFADITGIQVHYLAAGQGDPMILLHGYTQTSHMWRPPIAARNLEGCRTSPMPPQKRGRVCARSGSINRSIALQNGHHM